MECTVEEAEVAIRRHKGILARAAEDLGVSRQALHARVRNNESLQVAQREAREALLDVAETVIQGKVEEGCDLNSRWILQQLGKNRGYGQQQTNQPQNIAVTFVIENGPPLAIDITPKPKMLEKADE